jgi:GTP-binding protein
MFVDRARIKVTAGAGGHGCVSFRREKYVPRGGPNGGDGGDGGSIYFRVEPNLSTLLDIQYHAHWTGNRGGNGEGSDRHGKRGEDAYIPVPPGTVVRDWHTKEALADLTAPGQSFPAARGGRGGKGNARFANATHRVPRFAERGEPGEEREYELELKLIADVGIAGRPNAGKSTLLACISAARPKIADYPFTTLSPNLGVASLSGHRTLTVADIPGIIEGAAHGKGLGLEFLRHIERTRVLLFLIDAGDEDPLTTLAVLKRELVEYSPEFEDRPNVIAFNKADIPENRERYERIRPQLPESRLISAATGEGVEVLVEGLWSEVQKAREADTRIEIPERASGEYTFEPPYSVKRTGAGFRVEGKTVLRILQMTDFDNDEAVRHMQDRLERMGVFKALKRMGAREGQSIHIGDVELEYHGD